MRLRNIGPNQTEIVTNGMTILVSYGTPVAVFVDGEGARVTDIKWSNTATRHINSALERWGNPDKFVVPQAQIDALRRE